ncbi:hypothetical protein [Desulfobacula toluolica]|uniref:Uncharacterized protein n=1 Tax=Desulfobacula toluolica (strain DSM 7467 / Tol2) TaxID=651182 RepID=K0N9M4_DESTT|nr:hypothetical protein [Desulfobacula toluolica]CCK80654.1 uncharacterized protein TOL2_C24930 [Desulfobacula toluolica Tol2]
MLGFKKKRQDQDKPEADSQETSIQTLPKKKNKAGSKKKMVIILFFLVALGAASYTAYDLYLAPKDPKVYQKIELKHLDLPEEMVRFSFDYLPDLYVAMVSFNKEMDLFDQKITKINDIAQKYPEQKKIADKEKKNWEKAKNTLQKAFIKIEKPVKETYVLFCVNKEQGLAQIKEKDRELIELARNALTPAKELTKSIKPEETVPQGFIKANIYKLKKKFL